MNEYLVLANLDVIDHAMRRYRAHYDREDLRGAAAMGLVLAAKAEHDGRIRGTFRAYAARCARNAVAAELRKLRPLRQLQEGFELAAPPANGETLLDQVANALERLEPAFRKALASTARAMGRPRATASRLRRKAFRELLELLGESHRPVPRYYCAVRNKNPRDRRDYLRRKARAVARAGAAHS